MADNVMDYEKQHFTNYKNAVLEIIKNNTNALVDEDIMSLIKKPPLDSMDVIKTKLLSLAKKYKTVINTEQLSNILDEYRIALAKEFSNICEERYTELEKSVLNFIPEKTLDTIRITKKQLNQINKKIKHSAKEKIKVVTTKEIVERIGLLFIKNEEEKVKEQFSVDVEKFLKTTYQKQLLENMDIKILVKDTTLINGVREQGERYVFTKTNSHLFTVEN